MTRTMEINERQLQKALEISEHLLRKVAGRGEATALLAMSLAFAAKCREYGIDPESQVRAVVGLVEEI